MNQIADIIIYSNHKYIMDRGIPYRQPSSYKVGNLPFLKIYFSHLKYFGTESFCVASFSKL